MPLIVKGEMIINNKVEQKAPPKKVEFNNVLDKITKNIEEAKQVIEESPQYHEVHHGDLHKLYNTKSDYLRDMVALKD